MKVGGKRAVVLLIAVSIAAILNVKGTESHWGPPLPFSHQLASKARHAAAAGSGALTG